MKTYFVFDLTDGSVHAKPTADANEMIARDPSRYSYSAGGATGTNRRKGIIACPDNFDVVGAPAWGRVPTTDGRRTLSGV